MSERRRRVVWPATGPRPEIARVSPDRLLVPCFGEERVGQPRDEGGREAAEIRGMKAWVYPGDTLTDIRILRRTADGRWGLWTTPKSAFPVARNERISSFETSETTLLRRFPGIPTSHTAGAAFASCSGQVCQTNRDLPTAGESASKELLCVTRCWYPALAGALLMCGGGSAFRAGQGSPPTKDRSTPRTAKSCRGGSREDGTDEV